MAETTDDMVITFLRSAGVDIPVGTSNLGGFETEVLVASVRHPIHVLEAARLGAHVATMPLSVIGQLVKHPLTDIGLAKFLEDWKKVPNK